MTPLEKLTIALEAREALETVASRSAMSTAEYERKHVEALFDECPCLSVLARAALAAARALPVAGPPRVGEKLTLSARAVPADEPRVGAHNMPTMRDIVAGQQAKQEKAEPSALDHDLVERWFSLHPTVQATRAAMLGLLAEHSATIRRQVRRQTSLWPTSDEGDTHTRLTRIVDHHLGYRETIPIAALLTAIETELPLLISGRNALEQQVLGLQRREESLTSLVFRVMSWDSGNPDCSDCTKRQVVNDYEHESDCGHLRDLNATYTAIERTDCVTEGYVLSKDAAATTETPATGDASSLRPQRRTDELDAAWYRGQIFALQDAVQRTSPWYGAEQCLKQKLEETRKRAVAHAERTRLREPSPFETDDGMLLKLCWLRDTVGVDIENMFARALKEKDGRTPKANAADVPVEGPVAAETEQTARAVRAVSSVLFAPGDHVVVDTPDRPYLHGRFGVVHEVDIPDSPTDSVYRVGIGLEQCAGQWLGLNEVRALPARRTKTDVSAPNASDRAFEFAQRSNITGWNEAIEAAALICDQVKAECEGPLLATWTRHIAAKVRRLVTHHPRCSSLRGFVYEQEPCDCTVTSVTDRGGTAHDPAKVADSLDALGDRSGDATGAMLHDAADVVRALADRRRGGSPTSTTPRHKRGDRVRVVGGRPSLLGLHATVDSCGPLGLTVTLDGHAGQLSTRLENVEAIPFNTLRTTTTNERIEITIGMSRRQGKADPTDDEQVAEALRRVADHCHRSRASSPSPTPNVDRAERYLREHFGLGYSAAALGNLAEILGARTSSS